MDKYIFYIKAVRKDREMGKGFVFKNKYKINPPFVEGLSERIINLVVKEFKNAGLLILYKKCCMF